MKTWAKFCAAVTFTLFVACKPLENERLGHQIEDIELISEGPLAGHVAFLDGYDIFSLPVDRKPGSSRNAELKKLFDVRNAGIVRSPHGITYIPPLSAFAFADPGSEQSRSQLLLVGEHGQVKAPLPIKFPRGEIPAHVEGLTYIPREAPQYPNTVAMMALFNPPAFTPRIEIIDLTGQVLAQLTPGAPLDAGFAGGIGYQAPGRLLVNRCDDQVFTLDFSGKVVSGPHKLIDGGAFEGIAAAPDGRLVFGDYNESELRFFTPNFERLPQDDHGYQFGVQVNWPVGLAWDTARQTFIIEHIVDEGLGYAVSEVDAGIDQSATLFDVPVGFGSFRSSLTFVPEESRYAGLTLTSHIALFERNGSVADDIDLSAYAPLRAMDYVPAWQNFVLSSGKAGNEKTLFVVDRRGALVRNIVINAPQLNLPLSLTRVTRGSKTHFIIADDPARSSNFVEIDDRGNVLHSGDYHRSFNIVRPTDLTFIDSGPLRGSVAVTDSDTSDLVVFITP